MQPKPPQRQRSRNRRSGRAANNTAATMQPSRECRDAAQNATATCSPDRHCNHAAPAAAQAESPGPRAAMKRRCFPGSCVQVRHLSCSAAPRACMVRAGNQNKSSAALTLLLLCCRCSLLPRLHAQPSSLLRPPAVKACPAAAAGAATGARPVLLLQKPSALLP